jgi:phosphoglycerol transferase MdoB-like AlkP superfamily enzyme
MAIAAWLTIFTGTYIVYPWYRAAPPEGADLTAFPRSFLKADLNLAAWHTFGMEWKEHVGWFAPILATAVAYIVWRYGDQLAEDKRLRQITIIIFILAFVTAGIAGLMGALITKAAPLL